MNLFRKYLQRTPAFTALLALLMAVAIAFLRHRLRCLEWRKSTV